MQYAQFPSKLNIKTAPKITLWDGEV